MDASTETQKTGELTLPQTIAGLLRHYLGGRRGLVLLAAVAIGAALYLNWGWLAAAGIAPLLVAFAPCAIMCGLGLCMSRMGGKSCSTDAKAGNPTTAATAKQDDDQH